MRLSREELALVAELAKIELSEDDVERFRAQLSDTIEFIETMEELDTTNVTPTARIADVENVMRSDTVGECLSQADVLSNAPEQEDGYFRVPRIMEE